MTTNQSKIGIEDLTDAVETPASDADYTAWKEAKIKSALKQAEDRSNMIPAEDVWEKFGFER